MHEAFMRQALALAEEAQLPESSVGAVVVLGGSVVGAGATDDCARSTAHAECWLSAKLAERVGTIGWRSCHLPDAGALRHVLRRLVGACGNVVLLRDLRLEGPEQVQAGDSELLE